METGETLPLIWSLSRKLRRRFCPRAAVFHYREARRGGLPDASENDRRINRLHRVVPLQKYMRQLLLRVMREHFYRGVNDPEALFPLALEKMESDLRQMIFGNAPLVLDELYAHEKSVTDLRAAVRESLYRQCRTLRDGAWAELLRVPECRRRFIASPLLLNINDLQCYASPLVAYSDKGRLHLVELRTGSLREHPEVPLMHRSYAFNLSGRFPEAVRSCQLDPTTGDLRELDGDFDVSETLRTMSAEAAAHREELALAPEEIPVNTVNCGRCTFASYCGENFQRKEI